MPALGLLPCNVGAAAALWALLRPLAPQRRARIYTLWAAAIRGAPAACSLQPVACSL